MNHKIENHDNENRFSQAERATITAGIGILEELTDVLGGIQKTISNNEQWRIVEDWAQREGFRLPNIDERLGEEHARDDRMKSDDGRRRVEPVYETTGF